MKIIKGKQRFKLLKSQKIALQMMNGKIQEALSLAQARQNEFQATLNMIMVEEHNISKKELDQWKLTEDGQAIEKVEPKNPKESKKDKKKRKGEEKEEK